MVKYDDTAQLELGMLRPDDERPPLPEGWVWTTLGEIRVDKRKSISPKKTPEQAFELYSVPSFSDGKPEIAKGEEIGSSKQVVVEDTVLLCKINPRINRVWVVGDYSEWSKIASTEWIPFFKVDGIEPNYLCYFMQQNDFRDYLTLRASGVGGSLMRVKPATFEDYPFPLAPLPEQQRIVEAIETQFTRLDAAVAALKRVKANLAHYKASVLKAACEGRLVPTRRGDAFLQPSTDANVITDSDTCGQQWDYGECIAPTADVLLHRILAERRARWEAGNPGKKYQEPEGPDTSDLPELPEGWVWANVEQIGEVRLGRQRSPKYHQGPNMRPYLRAANATWNGVDLTDVMEMDFPPSTFENYRLQRGDILLAEASGSRNEVGKPFIWQEQIPDCGFQNTLIRVRLFDLPPDFVHLHFRKDALSGRFGEVAKGIGIHHLGADRLSVFSIALPPLAEQRRIVEEVERCLSVAAEVEAAVDANLARAQRLRQAILRDAFAGRLV